MNFNFQYLLKLDVVFRVIFFNKELCEKILKVIRKEHIELVDIVVE